MSVIPAGDTGTPDKSFPVWIFSISLIIGILVNAYIIWYFLVGMPAECAARAAATAGRETCGAGPAMPVILVICAALIGAGISFLYRWHIRKK